MSTWPENDEERELFRYWQEEVANGETLAGFRDWAFPPPLTSRPASQAKADES